MKTTIPIPPALEKKLNAIDLEVRNLYFKWTFFSQLFTDPNNVEVLNATAGALFRSIEDSMLSDIFLAISRLTDPSKSCGQENLSFENFIQEIPDVMLRSEVEKVLAEIQLKTKAIKTWRNKQLSHNDLGKALGSFSLPPIQKKDLTDTLELIPKIINLIHGHYNDTMIMYEECIIPLGNGDALMMYLEYGLDVFKEDMSNGSVDRLHKLQKKRSEREHQS